MKKFLFSLLTLAAALTVASCQKELQAGPNGEGPAVNASFAVSLGDAMTKAFADGTTVDKVYAALYEVGSDGAYTFVAEADPAEITDLKATVQINGKLKKGKSYRVAFWAQKAAEAAAEGSTAAPAASAYKVVWDPAPVVTVTPTGAANDEARDAFYGVYDTGEVKGNITAEKVIPLVRPFAQVNVLVPVGNLSADAAITSSMTIKQAPTTLNLNTGETGTPADYVFATASMAEPAFGTYAQTHKYVAMNYVLVDQATANHFHNVEFTVAEGTDTPVERKLQNIPLKANVRTNIVGNIFESFGFNGTVVITPEGGEVEATDIRIAVGTAGTSAEDPIDVTANGALVTFAISRSVDRETPEITYKKGGVVTATWDSASNGINIVPVQGVENGSDVVTVTFPEVTKTTYAEGKVDVYVKVGTGEDPVVEQVATPTFTPAAGEYTTAQSVEIACATDGATIHYTIDGTEPTGSSPVYSAAIAVAANTTIKAIAVAEGMTDSEIATAAYTIQVATPTFTPAAGEYTAAQSVEISCATEGATISYKLGEGDWLTYSGTITVSETKTISAKATKENMTDSEVATATYTINTTTSDVYTKVTNVADLTLGSEVIIVNAEGTYAAGPLGSGYLPHASVTLSDNTITNPGSGVEVFKIANGNVGGTYALQCESDSDKFLIWSESTTLIKSESLANAGSWAISISDGSATIRNVAEGTRYLMYKGDRFAAYMSTTQDVSYPVIYKKMGTGSGAINAKEAISLVIDGATTSYIAGSTYNFDGTVKVIYGDFSEGVLSPSDYTVDSSAVDMSTSGTYPVTITYKANTSISETFNISVSSASAKTATISFGSAQGSTQISALSATGKDSEDNTWTITTVTNEAKFNNATDYVQIGTSTKPATSITFQTTLPASAKITAFSSKFGGFSGTQGDIVLKVGDMSVGSGTLKTTSDVIIESTQAATGTVLTITVKNISKGVKVYYISYTYE